MRRIFQEEVGEGGAPSWEMRNILINSFRIPPLPDKEELTNPMADRSQKVEGPEPEYQPLLQEVFKQEYPVKNKLTANQGHALNSKNQCCGSKLINIWIRIWALSHVTLYIFRKPVENSF